MTNFSNAGSETVDLTNFQTQFKTIPYSIAAIGSLLVYEYLCTFDQEVAYIWKAPYSIGTTLFILNRYLPFIDTFMSLHLLTTVNTPEVCLRDFKTLSWFIVVGSVLSEFILMLRTYAIWERKRTIAFILIALCVVTIIPAIIITYIELASLKYGPSSFSEESGCFLKHASKIIYISYVLLILCETTLVILTMIKALQHLRRSRSRWIVQLYKDGLLYYVYILAISIVNVVIPVAAPPAFANWFATPQRVFHSIFCTRILLFIFRQQKLHSTGASDPPVFSSVLSTDCQPTLTDNIDLGNTSGISKLTSPSSSVPSRDRGLRSEDGWDMGYGWTDR